MDNPIRSHKNLQNPIRQNKNKIRSGPVNFCPNPIASDRIGFVIRFGSDSHTFLQSLFDTLARGVRHTDNNTENSLVKYKLYNERLKDCLKSIGTLGES